VLHQTLYNISSGSHSSLRL